VQRSDRYGVFLRPDPPTCGAVATVTSLVRAQYGLVSAGAFPPHATLVGSLPVGDPAALLSAVGAVLATVAPFPVHNTGVARLRSSIVYDVHTLDGRVNAPLVALAGSVEAAVIPFVTAAPGLPADLPSGGTWHGHLSLASHELGVRPELGDEVAEFVRGLDVPVPDRFVADTVSAYRFTHPTWDGAWWTDLRWEFVRSWRLTPAD
jgi:hypothetical protein